MVDAVLVDAPGRVVVDDEGVELDVASRVVLVEFRKEDPTVPIQPLHKMSVQDVRSELEPFGFKFQRSLEFLPWQHVIFFSSGK